MSAACAGRHSVACSWTSSRGRMAMSLAPNWWSAAGPRSRGRAIDDLPNAQRARGHRAHPARPRPRWPRGVPRPTCPGAWPPALRGLPSRLGDRSGRRGRHGPGLRAGPGVQDRPGPPQRGWCLSRLPRAHRGLTAGRAILAACRRHRWRHSTSGCRSSFRRAVVPVSQSWGDCQADAAPIGELPGRGGWRRDPSPRSR